MFVCKWGEITHLLIISSNFSLRFFPVILNTLLRINKKIIITIQPPIGCEGHTITPIFFIG